MKVGDEWMRVPTPFEWWYAFGAIPMALVDSFYRANPEGFVEATKESLKAVRPPIFPTAIVPPLELAINRSLFTGKPLVSESEKRLPKGEQAKPFTTATARKVAEILNRSPLGAARQTSPIEVERILDGLTGGLASDLVRLSEVAASADPSPVTREPADFPIVGRLFIRDTVTAVFDEFDTELETLEALRLSGQKIAPADLQRFRRAERQIRDIRQRFKQAKSREARRSLWRQMENLAERANNGQSIPGAVPRRRRVPFR